MNVGMNQYFWNWFWICCMTDKDNVVTDDEQIILKQLKILDPIKFLNFGM